MAEAILDALGPVLTRWTMGGSALAAAPEGWREPGGHDEAEGELRLLALAGQYLATVVAAEPRGGLRMRADLPALAKPPLHEGLRARARRLLDQAKDQQQRRDLLDFIDARGWTMHPGDWLPGSGDEVPAVYAPWQDWAGGSEAPRSADAPALTADTWSYFAPAALRGAFAKLRLSAPARARDLLAERIAGEAADARVRFLEIIETSLDEDDAAFLESLASDRAPRVRALAGRMLARLGRIDTPSEDAAELAAFFPLQTKGLLRRTLAIVPQPLKTPAQRTRRAALMTSVPLDAFVAAVGMDDEAFLAAWPWGSDGSADRELAGMVTSSGSDEWVRAVFAALSGPAGADLRALEALAPRLPREQRGAAAHAMLALRGASFAQAQRLGGVGANLPDPMRSAAAKAVLAVLAKDDAKPGEGSEELTALGLIAAPDAARRALQTITASGLSAADPRLDMLRLNVALEHRG